MQMSRRALEGYNPAQTALFPGLPWSSCNNPNLGVGWDSRLQWTEGDLFDTYPILGTTTVVGADAQIPGSYNCPMTNEVDGVDPVAERFTASPTRKARVWIAGNLTSTTRSEPSRKPAMFIAGQATGWEP